MSAVPKEIKKVPPKKVYAIRIRFYPGGGAMISRKDLPALIDSTELSVKWLTSKGFKAEDIEIFGDKPSCWETYYPAPVLPEPVPAVEKTATVAEPVVAPVAVDPIVQALGIPEEKVVTTVLTDSFVPPTSDASAVPPEIVS